MLPCKRNILEQCCTLVKSSHRMDRRNSKNFQIYVFLPTAREGNVSIGVCHSVHYRPYGYSVTAHPCLATWSLFLLLTAWSVRILLECFLVYVIFLRGREAMVSFQHNILAVPAPQLNAVFRDLPSSQSITKTSQKYTIQLRIQAKSQLCRTENESTNS